MDEIPSVADAFSRIPERNTGDAMLRTAQQHHVALSSMADTKANIIITVSSIVLTLSLGRIGDPSLRPAVQTLAAFTLVSLFFAILAVLPKHRSLRIGPGAFPPDFNLLFFGHFADLPRERFLREVATAMKPTARSTRRWPTISIRSAGTSRTANTATCASATCSSSPAS